MEKKDDKKPKHLAKRKNTGGKRIKSYKEEKPEYKRGSAKKGAGNRFNEKTFEKKVDNLEPVRLNKYIASSGICSRREADDLITKGKVKVNDKVVTEMGIKVVMSDKVVVNGKIINPEKKVYILLNKPKDCISTVKDIHAERTVLDIVKHEGKERIYPVGRLDRNTTGVLLLTNDGDLTKKLTHPSYNKKKIYHVTLDKVITKGELQQILEGIVLEDGPINADAISFVDEGDKRQIGIELHSGKNRIVRRIFEHLGYRVDKLDRVYFAGLTKKNVPRGRWRYLTEKEISTLKMGAYV